MRRGFFVFVALWGSGSLGGCAESSLDNKGGTGFDSGFFDTGGYDTGDGESDSATPVWWRLGATLLLEDGDIDDEESTLDLSLSAEDGVLICEEELPLVRSTFSSGTPDEVVLAWWRMTTSEPTGACAEWATPLPDTIYLGIGELHPDILASLDLLGLASVSDSLNGAYVSLDGGETVYVYGVAGSAAAFSGESPAADELPLFDATWTVLAVYPFAYGD